MVIQSCPLADLLWFVLRFFFDFSYGPLSSFRGRRRKGSGYRTHGPGVVLARQQICDAMRYPGMHARDVDALNESCHCTAGLGNLLQKHKCWGLIFASIFHKNWPLSRAPRHVVRASSVFFFLSKTRAFSSENSLYADWCQEGEGNCDKCEATWCATPDGTIMPDSLPPL